MLQHCAVVQSMQNHSHCHSWAQSCKVHLDGRSFQGSFTSSYFFGGQACCSIASCRTRDLYTAGADFGETLCIDAVQVDGSQQARELFGAIRIVRAIRSDVVQKQSEVKVSPRPSSMDNMDNFQSKLGQILGE